MQNSLYSLYKSNNYGVRRVRSPGDYFLPTSRIMPFIPLVRRGAVRSVKEDKAYGDKSEIEKKSIIEKFFNVQLVKDEDPYATFDFFTPTQDTFMELKSRIDVHSAQYPTTIISAHKVNNIKEGAKYIFIWAYTDGIFYLEYDKALWDTFECKPFKRYDRIDRRETPKPHYFVPREHLKPIII